MPRLKVEKSEKKRQELNYDTTESCKVMSRLHCIHMCDHCGVRNVISIIVVVRVQNTNIKNNAAVFLG